MRCKRVAIVHVSTGHVLVVVLVRLFDGSVVQKIMCGIHLVFPLVWG